MSERIFFDATLEPNRPLAPLGLALVIGLAALLSFCAGILFALRGAWPVTPFFGRLSLVLFGTSIRGFRFFANVAFFEDRLNVRDFAVVARASKAALYHLAGCAFGGFVVR